MDTLQKIKEIISEQTGIEEEKLSENTTIEDVVADFFFQFQSDIE